VAATDCEASDNGGGIEHVQIHAVEANTEHKTHQIESRLFCVLDVLVSIITVLKNKTQFSEEKKSKDYSRKKGQVLLLF
jgi:hypothetical protein